MSAQKSAHATSKLTTNNVSCLDDLQPDDQRPLGWRPTNRAAWTPGWSPKSPLEVSEPVLSGSADPAPTAYSGSTAAGVILPLDWIQTFKTTRPDTFVTLASDEDFNVKFDAIGLGAASQSHDGAEEILRKLHAEMDGFSDQLQKAQKRLTGLHKHWSGSEGKDERILALKRRQLTQKMLTHFGSVLERSTAGQVASGSMADREMLLLAAPSSVEQSAQGGREMTDAPQCWAVKSSDKSAKTLRRFKPLHTLAPHSTIIIDMRKAPLTGDIETVIDVFPSEATSGQEDPVLESVCDEGDDNRYKRAADRARRVATSFASQVTEKDSPNGIALDILRRILFHKDQADYRQSSPTEQKADLMQGIRYLTLVALRHEAACQSREGSGGSKEPVFAVRNNTTPPCSDADWHDSAGRLNRIWLGSDADKTKYANMSDLLKLELGQEAAAVGKRHIGHGPRGQAEAPKDFRPRW